jgi:hypothetical protein
MLLVTYSHLVLPPTACHCSGIDSVLWTRVLSGQKSREILRLRNMICYRDFPSFYTGVGNSKKQTRNLKVNQKEVHPFQRDLQSVWVLPL